MNRTPLEKAEARAEAEDRRNDQLADQQLRAWRTLALVELAALMVFAGHEVGFISALLGLLGVS